MLDSNQFSLKGKVAIVTAGRSGIGQAIAFGFAKAGATVVITGRKMEDLEATAREIKRAGSEAFPLQSHLDKFE
jgi:gluconate 5-dehydrogenase